MQLDILKDYLINKSCKNTCENGEKSLYQSKVSQNNSDISLYYDKVSLYLTKFSLYYDKLIEWNNKFNLTAITGLEDAQIKHFIDSILPNDLLDKSENICDVGCGAGFPSIPLAILNPDKKFTLVDSVNKKISFINYIIELLELPNVTAIHSRVEDFVKDNFQSFDACVARAVASMPTLAEYTLPLIKKGGILLAYKGINYKEELEQCSKILDILKGKLKDVNEYDLTDEEKRFVLVIQKIGDCPKKYPRNGNKPRLQPILG
ncbi:MAG: 16S rRNA (guanine(527)-N(7))-methyltransferase RsmG [Clostridia bacterium]|nr:16S rRNA (guanine(527)-N(7))-methyltransferase RsmG [Clostridia bacterium]